MAYEFSNRVEAGRALARKLAAYRATPDLLVLALPRGGVPVAYEVAEALEAPLDVLLVRKIGAPDQPELAMGAVASGGGYTVNRDVVDELHVTSAQFGAVLEREWEELRRSESAYRGKRPPIDVTGKTLIVVDDGLATGSTMRAAVATLRRAQPAKIVVAVPVAAPESLRQVEQIADDVVCPYVPQNFTAVGVHYLNFGQVPESEVRALLSENAKRSVA